MENLVGVRDGWLNVTTSNIGAFGQQIMVLSVTDKMLLVVFCANNTLLTGSKIVSMQYLKYLNKLRMI